MVIFSYIEMSILHQTRTGTHFRTEQFGAGDTRLGSNYIYYREDTHYGSDELIATLELSVPAGPINAKTFYPP